MENNVSFSDASINYDICTAMKAAKESTKVYLDTETVGFKGTCFLIQFSTVENPTVVHIIKVLNEKPSDICALLEILVKKILVIHNADFDIAHLSRLFTISTMVSEYSFDEVWKAEEVFRNSVNSYNLRMAILYCFYPAQLIDTYLLAMHCLPLANEFISNNQKGFTLYNFPYACLQDLKKLLGSKNVWVKMLLESGIPQEYIDYLKMSSRVKLTVKDKATIKKSLEEKPDKCLVNLTLNYDKKHLFKLKNLSKLFKHVDHKEISEFEFLDEFRDHKKLEKPSKTLTIEDMDLYEDAFNYCKTGYIDVKFLKYATLDVLLLQHVENSLLSDKEISLALQLDFNLAALMANLKVCGVSISPEQAYKSKGKISCELNPITIELNKEGLEQPSSHRKALEWLKFKLILSTGKSAEEISAKLLNTKGGTLRKLNNECNSPYIDLYLKYKKLAKALEYIPLNKDTMHSSFQVYGTVTGRMTSKNPNTQQIPRLDGIRSIFNAPEGYHLYVGDFDQLELRILAYLYRIENLINDFSNDHDPHSGMAARIFQAEINELIGKELDVKGCYNALLQIKEKKEAGIKLTDIEVSILSYRTIGKELNFMISYGATSHGLAPKVKRAPEEAEQLIKDYFKFTPELYEARSRCYELVSRTTLKERMMYHKKISQWCYVNKPIKPISNQFGLSKSFTVNQCLLRLLVYANRDYKKNLKSKYSKKHLDKFSESVRGGFKSIQGSINREAFNFKIQSTGSFLTKYLQNKICENFVENGKIHKMSELDLLPSINVHDELHFYVKGNKNVEQKFNSVYQEGLKEISEIMQGKFKIDFKKISNWAEKS